MRLHYSFLIFLTVFPVFVYSAGFYFGSEIRQIAANNGSLFVVLPEEIVRLDSRELTEISRCPLPPGLTKPATALAGVSAELAVSVHTDKFLIWNSTADCYEGSLVVDSRSTGIEREDSAPEVLFFDVHPYLEGLELTVKAMRRFMFEDGGANEYLTTYRISLKNLKLTSAKREKPAEGERIWALGERNGKLFTVSSLKARPYLTLNPPIKKDAKIVKRPRAPLFCGNPDLCTSFVPSSGTIDNTVVLLAVNEAESLVRITEYDLDLYYIAIYNQGCHCCEENDSKAVNDFDHCDCNSFERICGTTDNEYGALAYVVNVDPNARANSSKLLAWTPLVFAYANPNGEVNVIKRDQRGLQYEMGESPLLKVGQFPKATTDGRHMFYADRATVSNEVSYGCEAFRSCRSALRAPQLLCAWCYDNKKKMGVAVSVERQNFTCPIGFAGFEYDCPPEVGSVLAERHGNNSNLLRVYGSGFKNLDDLKLSTCGAECSIKEQKDTYLFLDCPRVPEESCPLDIVGVAKENKVPISFSTEKVYFDGMPLEEEKVGPLPLPLWLLLILLAALALILSLILAWALCMLFKKKKTTNETDFELPHRGLERTASEISKSSNIDQRFLITLDELEKWKEPLGEGHYGVVYRSRYFDTAKGEYMDVACKVMRNIQNENDSIEFLDEARTMMTLRHYNILNLIGVAFTDDMAPIIVMELMPKGNLREFVEKNMVPYVTEIRFGKEIASGMFYLHSCHIIHRDLAARNCMLTSELCVKISDFGLSRDFHDYDRGYVVKQKRALPVPWMPPEVWSTSQFHTYGDVWSYGVVLWEIFARGRTPYWEIPPREIFKHLKDGNRLERPMTCPKDLYENVMLKCWQWDPTGRPDFCEIYGTMNAMWKAAENTSAPGGVPDRPELRDSLLTQPMNSAVSTESFELKPVLPSPSPPSVDRTKKPKMEQREVVMTLGDPEEDEKEENAEKASDGE